MTNEKNNPLLRDELSARRATMWYGFGRRLLFSLSVAIQQASDVNISATPRTAAVSGAVFSVPPLRGSVFFYLLTQALRPGLPRFRAWRRSGFHLEPRARVLARMDAHRTEAYAKQQRSRSLSSRRSKRCGEG